MYYVDQQIQYTQISTQFHSAFALRLSVRKGTLARGILSLCQKDQEATSPQHAWAFDKTYQMQMILCSGKIDRPQKIVDSKTVCAKYLNLDLALEKDEYFLYFSVADSYRGNQLILLV